MFRKKTIVISVLVSLITGSLSAQNLVRHDEMQPKLFASVKQFYEFTTRFNYQTDFLNNPIDSSFAAQYSREVYLEYLFDLSDSRLNGPEKHNSDYEKLKSEFINDIVSNNLLINKDTNLESILQCYFNYNRKLITCTLVMKYINDFDNAYRWIISDVQADIFKFNGEQEINRFFPPNSDELGFMKLKPALQEPGYLANYVDTSKAGDQLPVFLYLVKSGDLKFASVIEMEYRYTGVRNWEIVIKNFNRDSFNAGWLISDLKKL